MGFIEVNPKPIGHSSHLAFEYFAMAANKINHEYKIQQLKKHSVKRLSNQRTIGPVNAHLISWPSKAQNIQNLEIYGKEMTLTFNTHIPS